MTKTELQSLLDRVREATGPDRELDRDIGLAIGGWIIHAGTPTSYGVIEVNGDSYPDHPGSMYPNPTESIDAALALTERVLPEANCVGFEKDLGGWDAYVSRNNVKSGHWLIEAQAPTAPLAILAATLSALIEAQP